MGLSGSPKSAIEVRDGMTFLDLSVRQIEVGLPRTIRPVIALIIMHIPLASE